MDLLYSRYSSPFEFMRLYMEQGRFGEFVNEIIRQENQRRKEQVEETETQMLWTAYIHSGSDKSFVDWKSDILKPEAAGQNGRNKDDHMTKADIDNLMTRLFS